MQKKPSPIPIEIEFIYGMELTDDNIVALAHGERMKIKARAEKMIVEYPGMQFEIAARIEAERLVKSYKLN